MVHLVPRARPSAWIGRGASRRLFPSGTCFLGLIFLCLSLAASAGARGVSTTGAVEATHPEDFVALRSVIPDLQVELRYLGSNNFTGRPIAGYEADVAYVTRPAALALRDVQHDLAADGLGLKVFDAYRPQRAVDDFMRWAADLDDIAMKATYYPKVDKQELIPSGYIAEHSGHSRGSTVDVTLVHLSDRRELDMGGSFDYFDPLSWPSSTSVTTAQHRNRMKLRGVMLRHGFQPLAEEWWHFTLRDEPYPDTYFDFPVR
jgi:D-alanyl-D-alanine dipeptidase